MDVEMDFQHVDQQEDLNTKMDHVDVNATVAVATRDDKKSNDRKRQILLKVANGKEKDDSPPELETNNKAKIDEVGNKIESDSSSSTTSAQESDTQTPSTSTGTGAGSQGLSSCKKSNLKKHSKYDSFSGVSDLLFTPPPKRSHEDGSPTPRKKIRIVVSNLYEFSNSNCSEDQNKHDESESIDDEEEEDLLYDVDSSEAEAMNGLDDDDDDNETELSTESHLHFVEIGGEKMMSVSRQNVPLDFMFVNEDVVKAMRVPVTKKLSVEIDMHFIDSETITELLKCKNRINEIGAWDYELECLTQIAKNNETQTLTSAESPTSEPIFIFKENARKLQNLDELVENELTLPSNFFNSANEDEFTAKEFYFADIWTHSKGYREYILKKSLEYMQKGLVAKGFAIQDSLGRQDKSFSNIAGILFSSTSLPQAGDSTEKDSDLSLMTSLPVEMVDHFHYTADNREIDICDILVSDDFVRYILGKTDGLGVHLLVADNGEHFNVHETVREVRFQKKFFAQAVIALLAVREGGNFIVKIFDAITTFTAGVIFLLHRCFCSVIIHKPKSSPTHSSERFLICRGRINCEETDDIIQFLLQIHGVVMHNEEIRRIFRKKARRRLDISKFEVRQIIPLKVIIGHADFFEFLRLINIRLTKQLCANVNEMCEIAEASSSQRSRAIDQANSMLLKGPTNGNLDEEIFIKDLLGQLNFDIDGLKLMFKEDMTKGHLEDISKDRDQWIVFPMQDSKRILLAQELTLFLGLGDNKIRYWDRCQRKWRSVPIEGICLTKGSLVLGNIVELFPVENESQNSYKISVEFHLCDAHSLSGKFIGDLSFSQRRKLLTTYISAINKSGTVENRRTLALNQEVKLEKGISSLSKWISCTKMKDIVPFYSGSMRFAFSEKSQVSFDGLCFWNVDGNFKNAMNKSKLWNWSDLESTTAGAINVGEFASKNL